MDENGLDKIKSNGASLTLYEDLITQLKKFAKFEVEIKKTSLHISNGRAFLGVHPRKDGLLVTIVSDSPISSDRMKKVERVSANRYHNEITLNASTGLDNEVMRWIRQAYALTEITKN